ncbi:MAG: hypothetical protein M3136_12400 [Thermoproteota archaeon]|nr:hypothetical protein [Thermoproteota archaeon]
MGYQIYIRNNQSAPTENLLIIDKHNRIAGIKDEEVNGKRLIVRKYKMTHIQKILSGKVTPY